MMIIIIASNSLVQAPLPIPIPTSRALGSARHYPRAGLGCLGPRLAMRALVILAAAACIVMVISATAAAAIIITILVAAAAMCAALGPRGGHAQHTRCHGGDDEDDDCDNDIDSDSDAPTLVMAPYSPPPPPPPPPASMTHRTSRSRISSPGISMRSRRASSASIGVGGSWCDNDQ